MKSGWAASAAIAFVFSIATTAAGAAEIRLAEQFSIGYLQFNVMKRDRLIEKYAAQRGWIADSGSKLPLEMVTKVVTSPGVEWTMTPAATMKFAMFRVGTTKHEPSSWNDMFFPEIGGLNGS